MNARVDILRAYGNDPIAYSTLQAGMRYMDTSFGYVAYRSVRGVDISLGPPICDPRDRPELLRRFLNRRNPLLCYVGDEVVSELAELDRGLRAAGMGVDWHPHAASLSSPEKTVRAAERKARRAGLQIDEVHDTQTHATRFEAITHSFLRRSQVAVEMQFLNRPMSYHADRMRRVFALSTARDGLLGYVALNPWFEREQVAGYLLDIIRFERTRIWGLYLATALRLGRLLAHEGRSLSLGFCPLWRVPTPPAAGSRMLQAQLEWLARNCRDVQYLERLRAMKSSFAGVAKPRHFVGRSAWALPAITALLRACGVPMRSLAHASFNRVMNRLAPGSRSA